MQVFKRTFGALALFRILDFPRHAASSVARYPHHRMNIRRRCTSMSNCKQVSKMTRFISLEISHTQSSHCRTAYRSLRLRRLSSLAYPN